MNISRFDIVSHTVYPDSDSHIEALRSLIRTHSMMGASSSIYLRREMLNRPRTNTYMHHIDLVSCTLVIVNVCSNYCTWRMCTVINTECDDAKMVLLRSTNCLITFFPIISKYFSSSIIISLEFCYLRDSSIITFVRSKQIADKLWLRIPQYEC